MDETSCKNEALAVGSYEWRRELSRALVERRHDFIFALLAMSDARDPKCAPCSNRESGVSRFVHPLHPGCRLGTPPCWVSFYVGAKAQHRANWRYIIFNIWDYLHGTLRAGCTYAAKQAFRRWYVPRDDYLDVQLLQLALCFPRFLRWAASRIRWRSIWDAERQAVVLASPYASLLLPYVRQPHFILELNQRSACMQRNAKLRALPLAQRQFDRLSRAMCASSP